MNKYKAARELLSAIEQARVFKDKLKNAQDACMEAQKRYLAIVQAEGDRGLLPYIVEDECWSGFDDILTVQLDMNDTPEGVSVGKCVRGADE